MKTGAKLLIVESPGKIKKIRSFLGPGWSVLASVGHIRDLPKKEMGIRFDAQKVTMEYVNSREKSKTIQDLKSAADGADEIFLGMDMDREGEAIAWHVGLSLTQRNWPKIKRITFTEITKPAIQAAIAAPRRVDARLVNAQQARRAVDRLVGFKVSPMVWTARNAGSSAGRVQSVAVRLVVEREREIRDFKPQEYWRIKAQLTKAGRGDAETRGRGDGKDVSFWTELVKLDGKDVVSTIELGSEAKQVVIRTEAEADALTAAFRPGPWTVLLQTKKEETKNPWPPYITSTLQQAGSVRLKWGAKKTMDVAQKLYEKGAITYMRTDSPAISQEALTMVRDYIGANFPPAYLPARPHVYKAKGGNAQEAHECIRPTHVDKTPDGLDDLDADQRKLYQLIWTQFVACQMAAARYNVTTIDVECGRGLFRARGRQVLFDGWTRLTGTAAPAAKDKDGGDADDETDENAPLPDVTKGERLPLRELKSTQHQTKPPPRYTEATLIRTLEKHGIGRPSTYASIMENIRRRGYIREEKRMFHAEPVGEALVDLLMSAFKGSWMDLKFTATMEEDLDKVAEGALDWNALVIRFNEELEKTVAMARPMIVPGPRTDRGRGLGAGGWGTDGDRGSGARAPAAPPRPPRPPPPPRGTEGRRKRRAPGKKRRVSRAKPTGAACEKCGKAMVVRQGPRGKFMACSGFPACRNSKPLPAGDEVAPVKVAKPRAALKRARRKKAEPEMPLISTPMEAPPPMISRALPAAGTIICQECGRPMTPRKGSSGEFWGCSGYPECKATRKISGT